jgi:hypothetical protein
VAWPRAQRPALRNCAEVYFFRFDGPRIADVWGIEDTLERFRQLALEPGEI